MKESEGTRRSFPSFALDAWFFSVLLKADDTSRRRRGDSITRWSRRRSHLKERETN